MVDFVVWRVSIVVLLRIIFFTLNKSSISALTCLAIYLRKLLSTVLNLGKALIWICVIKFLVFQYKATLATLALSAWSVNWAALYRNNTLIYWGSWTLWIRNKSIIRQAICALKITYLIITITNNCLKALIRFEIWFKLIINFEEIGFAEGAYQNWDLDLTIYYFGYTAIRSISSLIE